MAETLASAPIVLGEAFGPAIRTRPRKSEPPAGPATIPSILDELTMTRAEIAALTHAINTGFEGMRLRFEESVAAQAAERDDLAAALSSVAAQLTETHRSVGTLVTSEEQEEQKAALRELVDGLVNAQAVGLDQMSGAISIALSSMAAGLEGTRQSVDALASSEEQRAERLTALDQLATGVDVRAGFEALHLLVEQLVAAQRDQIFVALSSIAAELGEARRSVGSLVSIEDQQAGARQRLEELFTAHAAERERITGALSFVAAELERNRRSVGSLVSSEEQRAEQLAALDHMATSLDVSAGFEGLRALVEQLVAAEAVGRDDLAARLSSVGAELEAARGSLGTLVTCKEQQTQQLATLEQLATDNDSSAGLAAMRELVEELVTTQAATRNRLSETLSSLATGLEDARNSLSTLVSSEKQKVEGLELLNQLAAGVDVLSVGLFGERFSNLGQRTDD